MSITTNNVSVRFGGLQALTDVSFQLSPGHIEAVIGPNGAGKTTLLNVVSGFIKPTAGEVHVDNTDMTGMPEYQRSHFGIARSFQTPRFIPHLSIADNVLVGFFPRIRTGLTRTILDFIGQQREERELRERTAAILEEFQLNEVADEKAANVPLWRLRIMEIARCMVSNPQYVLLDEPAAGFDEEERNLLAEQVTKLAKSGVGVLLVEHNFGFIKSVSTHVTVLSQGAYLASGKPEIIESDPKVVDIYLGKEEH